MEQPSSEEQHTSESVQRSIVKTISWRILGTLDTIIISWLITGTLQLALAIGSIELITKMILYFLHERGWSAIRWGLTTAPVETAEPPSTTTNNHPSQTPIRTL